MVSAIGAKTDEGNGNDVNEAYNLIKGTVSKIRSGEGPFFLEFETYRYREHCGYNYDNDLGYRTQKEFEFWKRRDPIKNYQASMIHLGQINEKEINELHKDIQQEVEEAFLFAEEAPFPISEEAFHDVYSDLKE